MSQTIQFEDGAAYERAMAPWSQLAGAIFLDWLAPAPGQRWLDVGCGNGAFTELLVTKAAAAEVHGIDPSNGQLAFARIRPGLEKVIFAQGDAMALPFEAHRFDAACMALVIFFVPDPVKGVAEMVRVVRPGGSVAAYVWNSLEGGFPFEPMTASLRALGFDPPRAPSAEAARKERLLALWTDAGLEGVQTRQIEVARRFDDFQAYWESCTATPQYEAVAPQLEPSVVERLQAEMRTRLLHGPGTAVGFKAEANAVRGRVPGGS